MSDYEGPTTLVFRSCDLCKWHGMAMERSGLRPIYQHYCKHHAVTPESPDVVLYMLGVKGQHIGEHDETPAWCPVSGAKQAQPGGED